MSKIASLPIALLVLSAVGCRGEGGGSAAPAPSAATAAPAAAAAATPAAKPAAQAAPGAGQAKVEPDPPLFAAAKRGDTEAMEQLIAQGADVDSPTSGLERIDCGREPSSSRPSTC